MHINVELMGKVNIVSLNYRFLVASQLQAIAARTVFPCFDEPDMKANFTVSITHQSG